MIILENEAFDIHGSCFFSKIETGGGRHLTHSYLSHNADPEYFS